MSDNTSEHDHITGRPRPYISGKWWYRGKHRGTYQFGIPATQQDSEPLAGVANV